MFKYLGIFVILAAASAASAQSLPKNCGSLQNAYGPFDYTNPSHFREKLPRVELHHFDVGVESLRGHLNKTNGDPTGDLDYTLRAFPNHARALQSVARYELTRKSRNGRPLRYSADCYFKRAMVFKPADATVRSIYAVFLYKSGKIEESLSQFRAALEYAPKNPEIHYNFGLTLVKSGDLETAKHHAQIAYELGHPLPGLRNQLKRAGAW